MKYGKSKLGCMKCGGMKKYQAAGPVDPLGIQELFSYFGEASPCPPGTYFSKEQNKCISSFTTIPTVGSKVTTGMEMPEEIDPITGKVIPPTATPTLGQEINLYPGDATDRAYEQSPTMQRGYDNSLLEYHQNNPNDPNSKQYGEWYQNKYPTEQNNTPQKTDKFWQLMFGAGKMLATGLAEKSRRNRQGQYYQNNLANPYKGILGYNDGLSDSSKYGAVNYQEGGELSSFQKAGFTPPASRGDSIAVLNSQTRQNNYYASKPFDKKITNDPSFHFTSEMMDINTNGSLSTINMQLKQDPTLARAKEEWNYPNSSESLRKNVLKQREIIASNKKNGNKYYYTDFATPLLDYNAPLSLVDLRISPQGIISRSPKGNMPVPGNSVSTFFYDPLAVTPWDMLNPEQQKLRAQKYGTPEQKKAVGKQHMKNMVVGTKKDFDRISAGSPLTPNGDGSYGNDSGITFKYAPKPAVPKDPSIKEYSRNNLPLKGIGTNIPELMERTPGSANVGSIPIAPYQVDYYQGNELQTKGFMNSAEGEAFMKELDPATGLPEYRNRGDYRVTGRANKYQGGGGVYHPITNPMGYKPKVDVEKAMKPIPKELYEPAEGIKRAKALFTATDISTAFSKNPLVQGTNYLSRIANSTGDFYTAARYAMDGQYAKAGVDAVEGVLDLIPFRKGAINKGLFTKGERTLRKIDKRLNGLLGAAKIGANADDLIDALPTKEYGGEVEETDEDDDLIGYLYGDDNKITTADNPYSQLADLGAPDITQYKDKVQFQKDLNVWMAGVQGAGAQNDRAIRRKQNTDMANDMLNYEDGPQDQIYGDLYSGLEGNALTPASYDLSGVKLKSGSVNLDKLNPGLAASINKMSTLFPGLVVTSGNDQKHSRKSAHYDDDAVDIGANSSDKKSYAELKKFLPQLSQIHGFKYIDEGNHIHISKSRLGKLKYGGKIRDNKGYLKSNAANFTDKKIIDSNHITTDGMAFPILANGIPLYPDTGDFYIPGNEVVEYPMMQNGGTISDVKKFYANYLNSPNYSKRLRAQGYENPFLVRQERADALGKIKYNITDKDVSHFDPTNETAYLSTQDRWKFNTSLDNVAAHETSHGIGSLAKTDYFNPELRGLNANEIREIDKRNKLSSYDENFVAGRVPFSGDKIHDSQATELKADMDSLKYQLSRDAIYNTGTQEFNLEYLKKAKEKYGTDKSIKRLFDRLSDDDLIYLMNNVASNTNQKNLTQAQYGGRLKRFQKAGIFLGFGEEDKKKAKESAIRSRVNTGLASQDAAMLTPEQMGIKKAQEIVAGKRELTRRREAVAKSDVSTGLKNQFRNSALEERFRAYPDDPNSTFDEYFNPFKWLGKQGDKIGHADNMNDLGDALLDPLLAGSLAGLGTKTTGQFANNLVNPFAGMSNPFVRNKKIIPGPTKEYDYGLYREEKLLKQFKDVPVTKQYTGELREGLKEINEKNKNRVVDLLEHWAYKNPEQIVKNAEIEKNAQPISEKISRAKNNFYQLSRSANLDNIKNQLEVLKNNAQGLPQQENPFYVKNVLDQLKDDPNYLQTLEAELAKRTESLAKYGDRFYTPINSNFRTMPDEKIQQMDTKIRSYLGKLDEKYKAATASQKEVEVNPAFAQKIKGLYGFAGQPTPSKIVDPFTDKSIRDRTKVVYPIVDPEGISKLSQRTQDYLEKKFESTGGFRDADNSLTYGVSATYPTYTGKFNTEIQQVPFSLTKPSSWLGNKTEEVVSKTPYELVRKSTIRPRTTDYVKNVIAHEGGHDLQMFGEWGTLLDEYNPEFGYHTTHGKNGLSKMFQSYQVPPVKGDSHQTWLSGANELHSDLMAERFKIIDGLDPDPKKAVKRFRDNEALFTETIVNRGKLDQFFAPDVSPETKAGLLRLLPATAGALAGAGMMNKKRKGGLNPYQSGGPISEEELEARREKVVKRALEINESGDWWNIPEELIKEHPSTEGLTCIGGVCRVYKDVGLLDKIYTGNSEFESEASKHGFSKPLYGLNNLKKGDALQWRQSVKEGATRYSPDHAQIFTGKIKDGEYEFFDNFNKGLKYYSEDRLKEYLNPSIGEKRDKPSAQIISLDPRVRLGMTAEQKSEQGKDMKVSTSFGKYSRNDDNPNKLLYPSYYFSGEDIRDKTKDSLLSYMNDESLDKELQETLRVSASDLERMKPLVYGLFGQESNFGKPRSNSASAKVFVENTPGLNLLASGVKTFGNNLANPIKKRQEYITSEDALSIGPAQIKLKYLQDDVKSKFGINSSDDLRDNKKAYIGALSALQEARKITNNYLESGNRPELKEKDEFERALYWLNSPGRVSKDNTDAKEREKYSVPDDQIDQVTINAAGEYEVVPLPSIEERKAWREKNLLGLDKGSYPWKVLHEARNLNQNFDLENENILPNVSVKSSKKMKEGGTTKSNKNNIMRKRMNPYQDGGMTEEQMMQEQMAAQQAPQGGGDQMTQLVAKVEQAIQQGAAPQEVLKQLVQMGIPQEQATQIIQAVMQQSQQASQMRRGGRY